MTFPHSIFKAYDIRGIIDDTLTLNIAHKIGQAVGSEVIESGGNSIVIGRDPGLECVISFSSQKMCPLVKGTKPQSAPSKVDLPAPDGPITAYFCPGSNDM